MATAGRHDSEGDDAPTAVYVPPQHDPEGGGDQSLRPTRRETQENVALFPENSEQPEEGRQATNSASSWGRSGFLLPERPNYAPQTTAGATARGTARATTSRNLHSSDDDDDEGMNDDRENASLSSASCGNCSGGGTEMNSSSSSSSIDSFYIPVRSNTVTRSSLSTTSATPFMTSPTFMIATGTTRAAQPVRRCVQARSPGNNAPRPLQVRRSRSSPPWSGRNRQRPPRRSSSSHPNRRNGSGCECRNRSECLGDVPPCYHCAYLDVPPSYSRRHRAILDSLVSKLKSARHKEPNIHDPPRYESPFAPPSYSLSQQQQMQQNGVSCTLPEMEGSHNTTSPLQSVLAQRLISSSSSYIPIAIPFVREDSLTFGHHNGTGSRVPGGAGGSVGVLLSCRSSPYPPGGRGASSAAATPTPPPYSIMDIHSIGHAPWLSRRGCGHCLGYGVTTTGGPEDNAEDEEECRQCSRHHCLSVMKEVYTSACSRTLWYKLLYALPLAVVLSVCVLGFEEQPLALITYTVIFAFVVFFPLLSLVEVLTHCTTVSCNVDR